MLDYLQRISFGLGFLRKKAEKDAIFFFFDLIQSMAENKIGKKRSLDKNVYWIRFFCFVRVQLSCLIQKSSKQKKISEQVMQAIWHFSLFLSVIESFVFSLIKCLSQCIKRRGMERVRWNERKVKLDRLTKKEVGTGTIVKLMNCGLNGMELGLDTIGQLDTQKDL